MKILYAYRYGIVGGVCTQLLLRRSALLAAGHECELFFTRDYGLSQVLADRKGVHFGMELPFRRLARKAKFDAVVVIDSPELLEGARGGVFRRTALYLDVHTTTRTGLAYLVDIWPSKLDGIIVPTEYSAKLVGDRLRGKAVIQIAPNILNTEVFHPSAPEPIEHGNRTREFVWVGKLDRHKNWRLALMYTAMLKELFGDIQLHLVGGFTAPKEQAEAFFQLAFRLDIQDRVNWLDLVENAQLASIYRRCAVSGGAMLVTSQDESFGMAAAEALLCGCPLIANDLPVFREVFPDSPLIHRVDIWNVQQVAGAARSLDNPLPPGSVEALYQDLHKRYGPQAFVQSFETLLVGSH